MGCVARRWYYESCVVEKEQKNTEYLAKPLSFTIQTSQLPCRQRYDQENTTENSEPHHCTLISSCIHRIHSCFVFFLEFFFLHFFFLISRAQRYKASHWRTNTLTKPRRICWWLCTPGSSWRLKRAACTCGMCMRNMG